MDKHVSQLWEAIKALFEPLLRPAEDRSVKDVAAWDGAASNYADTPAYCASCLIDVNSAAGREEKAQSHCMLPVRGPGDSAETYVRQAVFAAAGGRGLGRVERPDDVPVEAWDAAVQAAANKIIEAYGQMDEQAPEAIYKAAGKEPPTRERAVSTDQLYEKVSYALAGAGVPEGARPIDIYHEGGGQFLIVANDGKLYRYTIKIGEGDAVTLVDPVEVFTEFKTAVTERSITVYRAANGALRWLAVTEAAVLNRDAQIDSRKLFDSFIEHATRTGEYPILTFFHEDALIRFGQADYLAREDALYIASGLFDDTPLARAAADGLESAPAGYWGNSNSFLPTEKPAMVEIAEGVSVPVYKRGVHKSISILPQVRAASLFTTIGVTEEVTRMKKDVYEQLVRLVGEDKAKEFAQYVDETERAIKDGGLITRDASKPAETVSPDPEVEKREADAPAPAQDAPVEPDKPVGEAERQVELDEAAISAVVAAMLDAEPFKALVATVDGIMAKIQELTAGVQAVEVEQAGEQERLAKLERDEEEKHRAWTSDLPEQKVVRVTYRPRDEHAGEETEKPTAAAVAESTLANMSTRR